MTEEMGNFLITKKEPIGSCINSVGIVTLKRDDLRSHLKSVGIAGFEPATSCSQSRRDNRTTLYPEYVKNEQKNCGQGRNRTGDTRLFRPLLYLLSYLSMKQLIKSTFFYRRHIPLAGLLYLLSYLSIGNKTTIKHKYPQKFK